MFHNLCRDYHENHRTSYRLCTIWPFAHDLFSRHKREDFIATTQTAVSTILGQVFTQTGLTALSSHQQQPHQFHQRPADFTPANCTGSISVCRFHASASHTSSIRIPRSSPDLEYPAWCSSSFHLTSPRSILVGLLLLTAVV